jgi:hypothetical protein
MYYVNWILIFHVSYADAHETKSIRQEFIKNDSLLKSLILPIKILIKLNELFGIFE